MKKVLIIFILVLLVGCSTPVDTDDIQAEQEVVEIQEPETNVGTTEPTVEEEYQSTVDYCAIYNQPSAEDYEEHKICCDSYMKNKDYNDFVMCESTLAYSK